MRYGVMIVPEDRWAVARLKWRRVEDLGFDHAWTYDHLNWRVFKDRDWFTSVPTLAAAALETSRITIGVLVASPNLRHPVHLAKDMATVADLADGRLVLGLGAGGEGFDASMTRRRPWSRRERTERFIEYVELLDTLLTEPCTSRDGRYYYADTVHTHPRDTPRTPFAIAAAGAKGMDLAARLGQTWVTMGAPNVFAEAHYTDTLPVVRDQLARFEDACVAVGRDPATLSRLLVTGPNIGGVLASRDAFFDAAGRFGELGITDLVVQWPRPTGIYQGTEAVLDAIGSELSGSTMPTTTPAQASRTTPSPLPGTAVGASAP